jgi:predicted regulator of Ras-like GTPase activity (Roadblock/LC7/MglB family)
MSKLDQLMQQIRIELGAEFVASRITGTDGIAITGGATSQDYDNSGAAARVAMIMKLAGTVSNKLSLGDVEDNLVTTDKVYVLFRPLGDGSYTWTVVVNRDATLGTVRMTMSEYAEQLWDAIPR